MQDVPHYAAFSKKKKKHQKFNVKDYKLGETGPLRFSQESKYSKKSRKWVDEDDDDEEDEDDFLRPKKAYNKNFKKYLHQGYHKYD